MEKKTAAVRIMVDGRVLNQIPEDLFIPADALEVLLDSFSGPLDLLLYLVQKQNIDLLDIPILSITKQYLHYIQLMKSRRLELAADYLLMAAMLAQIKSRLLLPPSSNDEAEEAEEDPRMGLVRRLQAYEQIKRAAERLDLLPRQNRDHFKVALKGSELAVVKFYSEVALNDLIDAMNSLLRKKEQGRRHQVFSEVFSVRERMSSILLQLQEHKALEFRQLFSFTEGRRGLVVSLLAILELARQALIIIQQKQAFSCINLQGAAHG